MALIKCPDCGKMFSVYAECCPDCGCPTKDAKAANIVNDSPIPQPTEEVGSNEQALSIIDEKSVEVKQNYNRICIIKRYNTHICT